MGSIAEARVVTSDVSDYLERAYGREQIRLVMGFYAIQLWGRRPEIPLHMVGRDAAPLQLVMQQAFPAKRKHLVTTEWSNQAPRLDGERLNIVLNNAAYSPWAKIQQVWPAFLSSINDLRSELYLYADVLQTTTLNVVRIPMAQHLYHVVPAAWAAWGVLCQGSEYIGMLPPTTPDSPDTMDLTSVPISRAEIHGRVIYLPWATPLDPNLRAFIGRRHQFDAPEGQCGDWLAIPYRRDLEPLFRRVQDRDRPMRAPQTGLALDPPEKADRTPEVFRKKLG